MPLPPDAPLNWETLGFGPFGAIPQPVVDYCDGPEVLGVPQSERYGRRWMAWARFQGVWIAPHDTFPQPITELPSPGQAQAQLFAGEAAYTSVSLCFDAAALPVAARQADLWRQVPGEPAGVFDLVKTIQVQRSVGGSVVQAEWPGISPRLFWTGLLTQPDTDVVCYYLVEGDDRVWARFARENFSTAYVVATGMSVAPHRLTKVDRVGERIYLWAMSRPWTPAGFPEGHARRGEVRQMVIKSRVPDKLFSPVFRDSGSIMAALLSGSYSRDQIDSAQMTGGFLFGSAEPYVFHDIAEMTGGFEIGELVQTVIPISDTTEEVSLTGGFLEGELITMDSEAEEEDQAHFQGGFLSGVLMNAIESSGPHSDGAQFTGGFLAGSAEVVVISAGEFTEGSQMTGGFLEGALVTV
jgi:hypothetical protein